MTPNYATVAAIDKFIVDALAEDIGPGDHSSLAVVPESARASARLLVKDNGLLAGQVLSNRVFAAVSSDIKVCWYKHDGERIGQGDTAFEAIGPARALLGAERLVLNILQRMSGIATYTARLNSLLKGTSTTLIDTRKTTPNFRIAEKWAVLIGGGKNHRFGLYDMIMLKDNHIDLAGGITQAIERAATYNKALPKPLLIEVETRNIAEVEAALATNKADRIMLDNMSLDEMKQAVALIGGQCETEASGGITETNLHAVANCGVDFISVGALTHKAPSLDLSLKMA